MLLALTSLQTTNAQNNEECVLDLLDPSNYVVTPEQIAASQDILPIVYNMAFWQINDENGNYTIPLTEDYVLTVVAEMNKVYNDFGIFFKYRGLQEFNSPPNVVNERYIDSDGDGDFECTILPEPDPDGFMNLSRCQRTELYQWVDSNDYKVANSFNVYIPFITNDFGGAGGSTRLLFNRNGVTGAGMVHEIGHSLGLPHTHGNQSDWRNTTNTNVCEHVTRDESITPNDDSVNFFNAFSKGDRFKDTAAVPDFDVEYCHFNGLPDGDCFGTDFNDFYVDENNCTYTGIGNTDCAGREYVIFNSDVRNYMSYTRNSCREGFSPEQIVKMRALSTSAAYLLNIQTTVESLYEPYKGEYYYTGPLNNGTDYKPLFQPGFDYWFIECSGYYPQPADYNNYFSYNPQNKISHYTKDELDYASITHPNHTAIKIGQVEAALGYTNIQKCYNNFNLSPSSGKLTKFNDGVLNINVTIQVLDSLNINNPQLINNLDPGLYNIEKKYNGNASQETIILKDNE